MKMVIFLSKKQISRMFSCIVLTLLLVSICDQKNDAKEKLFPAIEISNMQYYKASNQVDIKKTSVLEEKNDVLISDDSILVPLLSNYETEIPPEPSLKMDDLPDSIEDKLPIDNTETENLPPKLLMYKKLAELKPDNCKVLYPLAIEYNNNGKYQEALEILEKVISVDNSNENALLLYSSLCVQLNYPDKAKEAFNKLSKFGITKYDLSKKLAYLYYNSKNYDKAINELNKILKSKQEDTSARLLMALCLEKQGDVSEGIAVLKEILSYDPGNAEALRAIVVSNINIGSKEEAIKYLNSLMPLEKDNKDNYYLLGRLYLETFNISDSIKAYNALLNAFPEESEAYYQLSNIYSRNNQLSEAEDNLEKAIMLMPDNSLYHYALGVLMLESGNIEKVKKEIEILKGIDEDLSRELSSLIE